VIGFVTNAGFLDANTADGLRKYLADEFSSIYVFHLRGNQRTSGELSRREGGKIFGSGSRAPIAISILVKNPAAMQQGQIYFHDIGDYLSREQKFEKIREFACISGITDAGYWQAITPDQHGDWLNQRSGDFNAFVPFNDEPDAIFSFRSRGVETSRDDWVYNSSRDALEANIGRLIDFYNAQLTLHRAALQEIASAKDREKLAARLIDTDSTKIKWTSSLIADLARGTVSRLDRRCIGPAIYRPFCKMWLYYDAQLNHRYKEKLYPSTGYRNLMILVPGPGEDRPFSALITDALPNLHLLHGGQCFPLHWYDKADGESRQAEFGFEEATGQATDAGYLKRDGVTDVALANFRAQYADESISKEDIFYYSYGVLHSPEYREQYAADLKKLLPRIPYVSDFAAFS
jgi:predicted helicase